MATSTEEVGGIPLAATSTVHIAIDSAVSLVLPTTAQRKPKTGVLTCYLSVEVKDGRFTVDGTTPTTANGVLLTAPTFITLRGETLITAFKIIGVAAGGFINYGYSAGAIA